MPDPITVWALVVVAILVLILMLVGITAIYQIKTYHLLNESATYTTAPLELAEQVV